MARRIDLPELLTLEESFHTLTVEHLKPLVRLITDDVPTRKGELVAVLVRHLSNPTAVRALYKQLDELGQQAVQEATHHPEGLYDRSRFEARYGKLPIFYRPSEKPSSYSRYDHHSRPTHLKLFFPVGAVLPTDLRQLLSEFVPIPPPFCMPAGPEPPATLERTEYRWDDRKRIEEVVQIPVRVRETAREAEHDLLAVLRLCEASQISVSDKKLQPTATSQQAVTKVLQGGDFYLAEEQGKYDHDPAHDLSMKPFAWPMLVQAAGLVEKSGTRLKVTPAGRKALTQPPHQTLRTVWKKWCASTLLDEFNRVEVIKGQGKGRLSAIAARRKAIASGLSDCPVGGWVSVDAFFRLLRATDRNFTLVHNTWELYLCEQRYGSFGYDSQSSWEQLQGRYVLAFFFEYAATLGLIDVAYIAPQRARSDFRDRWGADDLSCLSRYDGLLHFRLNPLGAYCLELSDTYQPPALQVVERLQVLPNLDVVVKQPPLPPADRLVLERFAEPQSEGVWKLTSAQVLAALEGGASLRELVEFLDSRSPGPLPQTVTVFLDDLRQRTERLRDRGLVRLLECNDPMLARELASDSQLRKCCQLAGERGLVFDSKDEAAVRRALKKLGYVLPQG